MNPFFARTAPTLIRTTAIEAFNRKPCPSDASSYSSLKLADSIGAKGEILGS